MTDVTVIILTRDEALHVARAIASVAGFASRVLVVDSGSTDGTAALARAAGAEVLHHAWSTHAAQFNWALDQIAGQGGWVLRLDADEVASTDVAALVRNGLPDVDGIYLRRHIRFQGDPVRFGGVSGLPTMRLFRNGCGRAEVRWMDEHIVVAGRTCAVDAVIEDHNLKPLGWWIAKHNDYANREVMDLLADDSGGKGGRKRWIKQRVYNRLPSGLRALGYFLYRFILRGGFRDAAGARRFHVLQGFWYRYLVDAKLAEVRRHMAQQQCTVSQAAEAVLGLAWPRTPALARGRETTVSVVTAVRNGAATLPAMLESLRVQNHPQIEHVVQDGASEDATLAVLAAAGVVRGAIVSEPDGGIYDAINRGIARATGDVVGLLHADDQLADAQVLADIAAAFADPEIDGVYGDLEYVARDDPARVIRRWTAGAFDPAALRRGWMPPHPTLYLRREVFARAGLYDTSYRISGDYDAMLRFLTRGQLRLAYLPRVMVRMKMGGTSNRSMAQMLQKSREDYRAIRRHGVGGVGTLLAKNVSKLGQFRLSGGR